jgi:exodeoxyribonuclease V gamma subunit
MLKLTFANHYETLRDELLSAIASGSASPFAAEQIIIPSVALRRDLTLSIATRHGVCANVEFAYLAQWLWRQIGKVVPGIDSESPFAAPVLTWRIFQILSDPRFASGFPRLTSYLKAVDAVARLDFATRVASLFEQYMTYRPEWLADWATGKSVSIKNETANVAEDQAWQAALWRTITSQLGTEREHPASRFLKTVEMTAGATDRFGLPEAAHVFCLPAMPPLYIDILQQLGRWIDLRVYVLNPCREFWFDIVDRRRLGYMNVRGEADYHETGNPLLADWGQQTKAHIELVLERSGDAPVDDGGFAEQTSDTLLARLQNTILNLVDIAPGSLVTEPGDRSIEIHVCHSLTRELEVLQDQILALLAESNPHNPLTPADILVVTPDLEAAGPLIEAVFGNAPPGRYIPFTLTGRARSTINEPARAFLQLLTVATSRFTASDVFDLLQQPILARRFGIGADDLDLVRDWITSSGIRWALDGSHREQYDVPGIDRYSFDDGLQRLFLGYAVPKEASAAWQDRVPAGAVEGGDALLLGRFAHCVDELARLRRDTRQPKAAEAWRTLLFDTLDDFLAADKNDIDDLAEVRDAIRELYGNMARGGVTENLTLDVVRTALESLLDDPARGGVPTGKLTFSSISSLRSLPFRVICVVGLNDGAFPSAMRPAEFDLMALSPRPGDRQRRTDERNLFLDLLLAARDKFYLSYTGRSIRDNAPLPASILVAELIELLVPATCTDPTAAEQRDAARRRLVLEHPLQPFSARYFAADTDPRVRSFNAELCEAQRQGLSSARAAVVALPVDTGENVSDSDDDGDDEASSEPTTRFFSTLLAAPGDEWRDVSLDQLLRFFRNPCRYLLRERLGIVLSRDEDELADDEPFLADFSARTALADRLLPHYRSGMSDDDLRVLALAGIEYPPGTLGASLIDLELATLKGFAMEVTTAEALPCLSPCHRTVSFELDGESWRLTAAFADLRPGGLVRHRYDDTRATDYLTGWLTHLFLCALRPDEAALETRWISRNGEYRLKPCEDAEGILQELLTLYRRGLREPIHFFPKSAWKYIIGGESLYKATAAWQSTRDRPWGEEEDPAYRLALRGVDDPLDEDFEQCATTVFSPMMNCIEDDRL